MFTNGLTIILDRIDVEEIARDVLGKRTSVAVVTLE